MIARKKRAKVQIANTTLSVIIEYFDYTLIKHDLKTKIFVYKIFSPQMKL